MEYAKTGKLVFEVEVVSNRTSVYDSEYVDTPKAEIDVEVFSKIKGKRISSTTTLPVPKELADELFEVYKKIQNWVNES